MKKTAKEKVIVALTSIFLTLAYIGIGFGICSGSPEPTRMVASATIDESGSPFSKDELVKGAVATQEYSFTTHDLEAYMKVISEMNAEAQTPYASSSVEELKSAPDQYSITNDEISHLNDVYRIAEKLFYPLISIAVLAAFLLMVCHRWFGMDAVRASLLWSGAATLAIIVVFLIWSIISFQSLFSLMHALFFVDGTWTFPEDSLLITMLPGPFWAGIGAFWISITAMFALISLVMSFVLRKKVDAA